jgi:predicted DNA-binding transcriptional regulator AlpA
VENLNTPAAAAYLGKSASWLNKTRLDGSGPVYLKIGGNVRYVHEDLDAFLAASRRVAVYDFAGFANDNAPAREQRAAA